MGSNKYEDSKIYKLISDSTDRVYIGSTYKTLNERLSSHKSDYNRNKEKKNVRKLANSFHLFKIGNIRIELLESYPCSSKRELHERERYWIDHYKEKCINKCIPTRSRDEYYKDNREKYRELEKKYYQKNKQKLSAKAKEYREKNKDTIKAKDAIKITCFCGGIYNGKHKARHMKTEKHTKWDWVIRAEKLYKKIQSQHLSLLKAGRVFFISG